MAFCPACKTSWPADTEDCPVCGKQLEAEVREPQWVLLGTVPDKLSADFARETLGAYEIPVVIMSKSGFFGNVGLTLTNFYTGEQGLFEVSVPLVDAEEALELLEMTLGDKWRAKED